MEEPRGLANMETHQLLKHRRILGIFALILILFSGCMVNSADAKMWMRECGILFETKNDKFFLYAEFEKTECTVADWPIDRPYADLVCDDGSKHTLEIVDETIILFDGVELYEVASESEGCE